MRKKRSIIGNNYHQNTISLILLVFFCFLNISLSAETSFQDSVITQLKVLDEDAQIDMLDKIVRASNLSADQRVDFFKKIIDIAEEMNHPNSKAYALYELGHAYNDTGNFKKALSVALESLAIFSENNRLDEEAEVHSLLGMLYFYLEDFESTFKHFETALDIRKQLGDQIQIANAMTNMGNLMGITGDFDNAMDYYQQALVIKEKSNDLMGRSQLYNNIANIYLAKDELDKVLPYRIKALEIDREFGDKWQIALKTYNLAEYYLTVNDPKNAYPLIIESKSIAEELGNKGLINDNIHFLAWYYELIGDYIKALEYQKIYTQNIKETFSMELSDQVGEMQVKYETEKKEKEAQVAKIQLKTAYIQRLALIFIVVVVFIIAIFVFILFYKNKKDSKLLEKKVQQRTKELSVAKEQAEKNEQKIKNNLLEKTALLQELYHRTKNNMAIISALLSMEAGRSSDDYVKTTFRDIKNKIQAMSLVQNKLYNSGDLSNINFKEYVQDLYSVVRNSYNIDAEDVTVTFDLQDIRVLIDSAIPLGLVINELLSNIFKHAFPEKKGEIALLLFMDEDKTIHLELSDNGVGFPNDFDPRKDGSMGLTTVFSLVDKQLKGDIAIESDNGVKWHLKIKDNRTKVRV